LSAMQKLLRFGLFALNLDTEELRKDGRLLKLARQPLRIVTLLAVRPRAAVRAGISHAPPTLSFTRKAGGEQPSGLLSHAHLKCDR
jgi:hypothetical protein